MIEEIIAQRRKPKSPQKENPNGVDGRDTFQTPDYATEIVIPFLGRLINVNTVWECAAGLGKIARRLREDGFDVLETDLAYKELGLNFLTETPDFGFDAIVTNPPFSLKHKFLLKCIEYDVPFALLVPAEYAIWAIDAIEKYGCEKIIPRRRIDYITPNILNRIHEGEIWENSKEFYPSFKKLSDLKSECPEAWEKELRTYPGYCKWDSIYDAPAKLLRKYSSSYYHSMWLTRYFNLGKTETFVELTNEMKDNI